MNRIRPAAIGMALALTAAAYAPAPAAAQECKATAPAKSKTCTVGPNVKSVKVTAEDWFCGIRIKDVEDLINKFETGPLDIGTLADALKVEKRTKGSLEAMSNAEAAAMFTDSLFLGFSSPTSTENFAAGQTKVRVPFNDCFEASDVVSLALALSAAATTFSTRFLVKDRARYLRFIQEGE